MTIEEGIASLLATLSSVTTLVGTRIRVLRLAQSETYPVIRVNRISEVQEMHLRGAINLFSARVQVDSFSREASGVDAYAQARNVDAAVHGDGAGSGLCGYHGTVGGSPGLRIQGMFPDGVQPPSYDPDELRVVRISRDYIVSWTN